MYINSLSTYLLKHYFTWVSTLQSEIQISISKRMFLYVKKKKESHFKSNRTHFLISKVTEQKKIKFLRKGLSLTKFIRTHIS